MPSSSRLTRRYHAETVVSVRTSCCDPEHTAARAHTHADALGARLECTRPLGGGARPNSLAHRQPSEAIAPNIERQHFVRHTAARRVATPDQRSYHHLMTPHPNKRNCCEKSFQLVSRPSSSFIIFLKDLFLLPAEIVSR